MNHLVEKYLAAHDRERAAFMHIFTKALSWSKKDIGRIYNFETEELKMDKLQSFLDYASSGEDRCIKLAVVLYNGGYCFNDKEIRIDELFKGLDSKRFSTCMEAMEIRFGNCEKVIERYREKGNLYER